MSLRNQEYITKFRKFRDSLSEQLGIRDEEVILNHWMAYLEHFVCMCHDCEGDDFAPDISYTPQWPDRFDPEDEEGDFTP